MKRTLGIIVALLVMAGNLFAIGFGYHVIEAKAEMEFASGIFPIALNYKFNFPVPDFISGSSTELSFSLDNGLDFRTLRQNPSDGSFYALDEPDYPVDYMTVYDEFNLSFNQGFADNSLTIGVSIDGRFENSYEALGFMEDGDDQGLFWDGDVERFKGSSFIGAPELSGDRSVFQTYLSAVFELDFMDDHVVRRDGARFESYFRITGPWMPMNDGSADFMLSRNTLSLAKTLFSVERSDGKGWISFVFDNETTYRFILGDKVPQYIQGGELWNGVAAPATEHIVTNSTSLTWYGPQLTADTYPSVSVFYDIGLSLGKALNSSSSATYSELVAVYGIEAEIMILDVAKLYWQWGFVTNPVFDEECRAMSRIGFTLGI